MSLSYVVLMGYLDVHISPMRLKHYRNNFRNGKTYKVDRADFVFLAMSSLKLGKDRFVFYADAKSVGLIDTL